MESNEKVYEGCTLAILTLVVGGVGYFALALVVGQMWDWYVTPIFGIARPDYALLVGLCVLVGYITNSTRMAETISLKKEQVGAWLSFFALFYDALISPFIILLIGWLVHFFI
jgi:fluoride ion exporter CrcB/FEX